MAHAQTPYLTKDVHDHQSQRDVGLPVSFKTCGRFIRNSRLDTGFSNPLNLSKNHSTVDQTHHYHLKMPIQVIMGIGELKCQNTVKIDFMTLHWYCQKYTFLVHFYTQIFLENEKGD